MFTQMFTFTQIFLSRENDPQGWLWGQMHWSYVSHEAVTAQHRRQSNQQHLKAS